MVSNRMTEGVGKKIVDALKKQTDVEITSMEGELDMQPVTNDEPLQSFEFIEAETPVSFASIEPEGNATEPQPLSMDLNISRTSRYEQPAPASTNTFSKSATSNLESYSSDFEDFELPKNVDVLKQLITKLPSGVSKQTGAQIIKQTMEALGISMKNVLQDAQQIQENLNNSAHECQNNVLEYKRQISVLEKQTQKYQRQYAALNDVISLFIQTGN